MEKDVFFNELWIVCESAQRKKWSEAGMMKKKGEKICANKIKRVEWELNEAEKRAIKITWHKNIFITLPDIFHLSLESNSSWNWWDLFSFRYVCKQRTEYDNF